MHAVTLTIFDPFPYSFKVMRSISWHHQEWYGLNPSKYPTTHKRHKLGLVCCQSSLRWYIKPHIPILVKITFCFHFVVASKSDFVLTQICMSICKDVLLRPPSILVTNFLVKSPTKSPFKITNFSVSSHQNSVVIAG